jgi:hypothetical protein
VDDEIRVTNPTTGGQKGQKRARYDLVPSRPLRLVAETYGIGAEKYEANNWRKGVDWSLNFAALNRHLWQWWEGQRFDDAGFHHLAAVCFHAMALMEFEVTHPELDDRHKD